MSVLAILGLVFLAFIGKFIWDSFLTSNTDNQFETNKKLYPEETARLENSIKNGNILNFNYEAKSNPLHKAAALTAIAESFGCAPSEAKDAYQKGIKELMANPFVTHEFIIENINQSLKELRNQKRTQALENNIDPDDTPAAYGELWVQEIFDQFKRQIPKVEAQQKVEQVIQKPNSLTCRFGKVTVSEILAPDADPEEKVFGSLVVYTQELEHTSMMLDESKELRRHSSYHEAMDMVRANGWKGIKIGDQEDGYCISILSSNKPFYEGQQRSRSGFYCTAAIEESESEQPNDRNIDDHSTEAPF